MKQKLPWILVGALVLWFASSLRAPKDRTFAASQFGQLPVIANGRLQPIDSLARNSLLQLREKQRIYLAEEKRYLAATEWLMEMLMNPEVADNRRSFRVDHPELKSLIHLPDKDPTGNVEDGKHYTWNQIKPGLDQIRQQAERISKIEASHRTPFEQAVWHLQNRMFLYMRLQNTLQPQDTRDFPAELDQYVNSVTSGMEAFHAQEKGQSYDQEVLEQFSRALGRFDAMNRMEPPLLIPPTDASQSLDDWKRVGQALLEVVHGHDLSPAVKHYAAMAGYFRQGKVEDFNKEVAAYRTSLETPYHDYLRKASSETFFNRVQPFYQSLAMYVLAFLAAATYWFNLSEVMRRSSFFLVTLAFIIHSAGLIFRMSLEGRPPVTNLYSSAVFIGWGAVGLGMILERFYRDSIGLVVASSVGFLTLIIAHQLSLSGDTMEMMQAVLDTNFWLATHVVVVTLGYASTFVAGFLAIIYLLRGLFTTTLSETTGKSLARMVYGIICFATLFSFVGTVLGGIWADQSWGRFWGWDPKENGALIIVLWNALILHARWGGMIKERGLMNMAVFGNIVTGWSWFGVNMLGIGLHSYGFMDSAFKWLMFFIGTQLLLIGLGLLPKRLWASFRATVPKAA